MLIDLGQRLGIVSLQADLFPKVFWGVRSLNRLYVEVAPAIVFPDGCVPTVCERAAAPIAQPRHIVRIAAEILCLGLGAEAAVLVSNQLPNDLPQ